MKRNNSTHRHVVFITGGSSGIGKACCEYLYGKGYKVYGTYRNRNLQNEKYEMVYMDLTDQASIKAAIGHVLHKEKRIDVLINNAGIHIAGALEQLTPAEYKLQFDVNFFGVLSLIQHVIPQMRKQQDGLIINISSIGGLMGLPFQGIYCASKFALEGLTESLRLEIRKFGIHAVLVEPGDFPTGITSNRIFNADSLNMEFYKKDFTRAIAVIEKDEQNGPDPLAVGKLIEKIILNKNPKPRYSVGLISQRAAIIAKKILPSRLFEKILKIKYISQ